MDGNTPWPVGGGETGALIRERDWSATPLGPLDGWPATLRTAVDIVLHAPDPAAVLWGPEHLLLYNDAYAAIAPERHPALFGAPALAAWAGARALLGPLLGGILAGGPPVVDERVTAEEGGDAAPPRGFTLTFSPVHDERGGVAGVFHRAVESAGARAAAPASEEQHRAIVEGARDYAILTIGPDRRITSWSPGAEAVYGWAAGEVLGREFDLLFTPEDREAGIPAWELQLAADSGSAPDIRWHLRGDGTRVFIDGSTRVLRGVGGAPAGFLKIGQDVTGRRRMEEALRDSEERNRLIVEGARDYAILTTDTGGRVTGWSPGAEAVYGWPAGEVIGQDVAITFTPEDRAGGVPEEERATAREQGWAPDVRWHLRRDGARVFIDGTSRALFGEDATLRGFLKVGQDVTERRQTEDALRESEERFRAVADLVPDLLWSNDPGGMVTWYNRRWMEYTGQTLGEALGEGWTGALHPDDRGASLRTFHAAVAAGQSLRHELRIRGADGDYRWFLLQARPVRDADGGVTGWFGAATDIHELRKALELLRELNLTLEERVAQRTHQLAAANRELRVEMRQREAAEGVRRDLLRQVVTTEEDERRRISREMHDQMGQRVTALLLGLKALEREAGAQGVEPLRRLADGIARDVQSMALQLRPPALDSLGLVPAVQDHMEEWSRRFGIRCDFHAAGVAGERLPPEIETTVYRVVQEGLTNVLKHAAATRVSLVLERRRGMLSAILEDDGRGFEVDAVLASPEKARRLGIRGMRERVALLGGELQIESSPGGGTTLYIRLPEAGDAPAAPPAAGEER